MRRRQAKQLEHRENGGAVRHQPQLLSGGARFAPGKQKQLQASRIDFGDVCQIHFQHLCLGQPGKQAFLQLPHAPHRQFTFDEQQHRRGRRLVH